LYKDIGRNRTVMQVLDAEKKLEFLRKKARVDLSVNDVRIILGCFRALAYQGEIDDEPYLDHEALELKMKLESIYLKLLQGPGNNGSH
jgi:hypothetical protein